MASSPDALHLCRVEEVWWRLSEDTPNLNSGDQDICPWSRRRNPHGIICGPWRSMGKENGCIQHTCLPSAPEYEERGSSWWPGTNNKMAEDSPKALWPGSSSCHHLCWPLNRRKKPTAPGWSCRRHVYSHSPERSSFMLAGYLLCHFLVLAMVRALDLNKTSCSQFFWGNNHPRAWLQDRSNSLWKAF